MNIDMPKMTTVNTLTTHQPLITPADVLSLGTDAIPPAPPTSCHAWLHLPDEDSPVEGVTVWGIGERGKTDHMETNAMQTALLWEVMRHPGVTLATNRNTPRSTRPTAFYGKCIFAGAAEDNMTVHRLLGAAEAGEQVSRADIIPTDLRGAINRKSSGSSKKDAWATVYGHCKRYAERAAQEAAAAGRTLPYSVEAYLANLEALYVAATGQGWVEAAE